MAGGGGLPVKRASHNGSSKGILIMNNDLECVSPASHKGDQMFEREQSDNQLY